MRWLGLFFIFLLSWVSLFASAATLETLDEILTRKGSLQAFLADEALVKEYYNAASNYFGVARFPKASYLETINQVRELVAKNPVLADRLWETKGLGVAFSLQSAIKTSGRELHLKNWEKYLAQWKKTLEQEADSMTKSQAAIIGKNWSERAKEFETYIPGQGRTRSGFEAAKGAFYKNLKESKEIRAASAFLLLEKFKSEEMRDLFSSGDADLILDSLRNYRANPIFFLETVADESRSALSAAVRSKIPSQEELLSNQKIFVIMKIQARNRKVIAGSIGNDVIESKPVPRRFHGLWKGFPLKECVGGGKTCELTPQRWGTVALRDVQLYYLERNGRHLGFVQLLPIADNEKIYASIDFGAPILRQKIFIVDEETRKPMTMSLAEAWVKKKSATLPAGWAGIVQGESKAINNAGVLDTILASRPYIFGKDFPDATHFQIIDPLVQTLSNWGRGEYGYGNGMIFDAGVKGANRLVLLDPAGGRELLHTNISSALVKKILTANDNRKIAIINFAAEQKISEEEFSIEVAKLADGLGPYNDAVKNYFKKIKNVGKKAMDIIFSLTGSPNPNTVRSANKIVQELRPSETVLQALIKNLNSQYSNVRAQAILSMIKLFPNKEEVINIVTNAILKEESVLEYRTLYQSLALLKRNHPIVESTFIKLIKKNAKQFSNGEFPFNFHYLIEAIESYQSRSPAIYRELALLLHEVPFTQFVTDKIVSALVHAPKESMDYETKKILGQVVVKMDKLIAKAKVSFIPPSQEVYYSFKNVGISADKVEKIKGALQLASGNVLGSNDRAANKLCPTLFAKVIRKR